MRKQTEIEDGHDGTCETNNKDDKELKQNNSIVGFITLWSLICIETKQPIKHFLNYIYLIQQYEAL